ncbi:MAG: zeta toxin family protein, partial [Verrucomicrobiota bacterium]
MTLLEQMLASLTQRTAVNGKLHFDEPSAIDIFEYCTAGIKGIGPEEHPTLYCVGGDAGSGKSTIRQSLQLQGTPSSSVVLCDTGIVMGRSREYHHDRQALGAQAAYEKWQEPAQAFSRALLTLGFNQQWNILYEGSLDADTYFFLRNASAQGYRTDITLLYAPSEVLQQRIQE